MPLPCPGCLFAAVLSTLAAAGIVGSPQALADLTLEPAVLKPVTVTGTRIRSSESESSAPLTVLDRQDFERMGITGIGEFLQDLPMMSGSPTSSGRNFTDGPADGSVAVDLRGLGVSRTLVLINGQRMPSQINDLSVIPVAMVERVDILKSGASSVYGADAVAGVVNVVTRRDFEGATLNLQTGESFDLGGQNASASIIWGRNFKRGNVVAGVEYTEQKAIFAAQYTEPWLRQDLAIIDPQEFRRYGFSSQPFEDRDGNGIEGWGDIGSGYIPNGRFDLRLWNPAARFWTICQGSEGGGSLVSDYGPATRSAGCGPNTYNYAEYYYVQTPYERSSVFLQTDLTFSDSMEATLEARYSNRQSQQNWAPLAYDSLGELDPAISADNAYNPFGVNILRWGRRLVEGGDRLFTQDVDQRQVVARLSGQDIAGWGWDLSYNLGRRDREDLRFGELHAGRLEQALGPSFVDVSGGQVVCGTPEAPIAGCVSLNAFTNPDSNPIAATMLEWLALPLAEHFETKRQVFNAALTRELPGIAAGPMVTAFGYEYRRESYTRTPDDASIGVSTNPEWGEAIAGSYRVQSIFGELHVPLMATAAGANLLDLDLSARYDDYSRGDSAPTWQTALRWHVTGRLMLRATAGRVFREPNVTELFAGREEDYGEASDPCSGIGGTMGGVPGSGECEGVPPGYVQLDSVVRVMVGGNESLVAEEGSSYSAGVVWTPRFLDGLTATLDWWRIELDDAIGEPGPSIILSGCFSGAVPAFCESIHRFGPESEFQGELNQVDVFVQNVGPELAEGIDWSVGYVFDTTAGLWNVSWFGTWNIERRGLVLRDVNADGVAEAVLTDLSGRFEHRSLTPPGAYPEWRWRLNTDWSRGNWGAGASIDFIGELTECGNPHADQFWLTVYCPDDPEVFSVSAADTYFGVPLVERTWENTVGPTWYLDLSLNYSIPRWRTQLTVGITNLTDKPLPFFQQGFVGSTDGDTFRTFGRSWFLRLRQDF